MEWVLGIVALLLILKRPSAQTPVPSVSLSASLNPSEIANALDSLVGVAQPTQNLAVAATRPVIAPVPLITTSDAVSSGLALAASDVASLTKNPDGSSSLGQTVGGVAGAVLGLASLFIKLFQGCGQSCINASKINQVFYAVQENLGSLQIQHFLPFSDLVPMYRYLLQQAQGSFPGDTHGQAGLALSIQTLQAAISFAQAQVATANYGGYPLPTDLHDYYIRGPKYAGLQPQWAGGFAKAPSQGGSWYSDALDQADNLTDELLAYFGYQPGSVAPGYTPGL